MSCHTLECGIPTREARLHLVVGPYRILLMIVEAGTGGKENIDATRESLPSGQRLPSIVRTMVWSQSLDPPAEAIEKQCNMEERKLTRACQLKEGQYRIPVCSAAVTRPPRARQPPASYPNKLINAVRCFFFSL